jgi:hypothetical protein
MSPIKARRRSRPDRVEIIETSLIVALAALVVIKGAAAVGGVFLGLGQMMAALVSIATH